jgi:hypothetical protein
MKVKDSKQAAAGKMAVIEIFGNRNAVRIWEIPK